VPLALHPVSAPQTEAIEPLIRANVAEHRFHHRHPVAIDLFALRAVYPMFHPVGVVGLVLVLDGE
jgi:hypothetical protein